MQIPTSLTRESTTDALAGQLRSTINLAPPPALFSVHARTVPPVAVAAPTLHPHVLTNIEEQSTKLQRAAQRDAQAALLQQAEPTTPTEEELELLQVEEIHASQTLEKAKSRFKAKARQHEELRARTLISRQRFEASVARKKQERMRALLQLRMQRQQSEE